MLRESDAMAIQVIPGADAPMILDANALMIPGDATAGNGCHLGCCVVGFDQLCFSAEVRTYTPESHGGHVYTPRQEERHILACTRRQHSIIGLQALPKTIVSTD